MIRVIFESAFIGMFVLTMFCGIIEFAYNIKNGKPTPPRVWIIPAIMFTLFWATHF